MRKLVTVRTIAELNPIPGADLIEVATIDGWNVVTKKGEFNVGDPCVYFEIDSFLPDSDARYAFLMKAGVRTFEGARGHRLRTIRLRGQLSQGLVLPLAAFPEITDPVAGVDYSELLGIVKWEAPVPTELAGQVEGAFPSFIPKTDEERCQNLHDEIFVDNANARYEITTKLDGTSCTIYHNAGKLGVCSRNWELKINDENAHNALVRAVFDNLLNISLPGLGNLAIQGELIGPGIQGNPEKLKATKLYIFNVYDIDRRAYLTPAERVALVERLRETWPPLDHVPVLANDVSLEELGITDIPGLLKFAEGPSLNSAVREGVVFKRTDGSFSFKAISNQFLLAEK